MRTLVTTVVGLGLLAVACGDGIGPLPSPVGRYVLELVNGQPLPVWLNDEMEAPFCAGELVLQPDQVYEMGFGYGTTECTIVPRETGTWSWNESTHVILEPRDWGPQPHFWVATYDGEMIEFSAGVFGTYTFTRE